MLTLKKSLGQHFLIDEEVTQKIVEAIRSFRPERLLEIGPGGGALTKYLLELPTDFKCVEIDQEKVTYLRKKYPALKDRILHEDILTAPAPFDSEFMVCGNFPYNISTEIVFRLLGWRHQLQGMVGMFQKEVAQRLAAKEGSKIYGVTSVLIQAHFKVEYLFEISELAFDPPPKVKSAVISMTPLAKSVSMKDERSFSVLVKTAFGQRRKTLRNAVKALFDEAVLQEEIFNKRAEALSVETFGELTFRMK